MAVKDFITDYLSKNPILAIFICLAVGYMLDKIKIKSFSFGATLGTLIAGVILSRFTTFTIPGMLVSVFSILFCFTIGYEAGPSFFKNLKSNGVKFIIQSVFFCTVVFVALFALGKSGVMERDSIIGMAAGALTQSSILSAVGEIGDKASISYAVTYIFGMGLAILFASWLGPVILRTSLKKAVREKEESNKAIHKKSEAFEGETKSFTVFPRAFKVEKDSEYCGKTIESFEDEFDTLLQVVKVVKNGTETSFTQETIIEAGDILTLIGRIKDLVIADTNGLSEVCENKYISVSVVSKEIIVTEKLDDSIVNFLSDNGIVLQKIIRKEKNIEFDDETKCAQGDVLKVSGAYSSIRKVATCIGYVKENGSKTDIPFIAIAISLAIIVGAIKIGGYSFGESTCALLIGLICGWYNNKSPKYGPFPESARWVMKNLGLNLFIATKALTTGEFSLDAEIGKIVLIGVAMTLVPHILTLLFCKFVLKMKNADILGGACGSGTCTAAINAITESSESQAFTPSFATTNAISNILLTVVGVILAAIL